MGRRIRASREDVPYRPRKHIEEEAALLLAEYAQQHSEVTEPPIPVDDIVELHLGLTFEIKDMRELFGHGDVHGALWINDKRVGVDQCLDPDVYPAKLGRFRFTLAHEVGHWRLHREHFLNNTAQRSLFEETDTKPAYVCRSSDSKKPIEWQADFFSACLLMPRPMIYTAWETFRDGDDGPVAIADPALQEEFCKPLAEQFSVSAEAMRIRLNELKLLVKEKPQTLF